MSSIASNSLRQHFILFHIIEYSYIASNSLHTCSHSHGIMPVCALEFNDGARAGNAVLVEEKEEEEEEEY
jgi:hypothetical protein